MNLLKKILMPLFIIVLASFSLTIKSEEVGQQAPSFEGLGHDGKTYKLDELKGQIVILEWYNRDCPFVRKFYDVGKMQELQKKFQENATWLTVVSSKEGAQGYMSANKTTQNFKKENSNAQAVIIDKSGEIGKAYGAKTTPQIVVIDEEGILRYNGAIDSIPSANSEDIEEARNYLELAMNELTQGKELSISRTNPYGCSVKY